MKKPTELQAVRIEPSLEADLAALVQSGQPWFDTRETTPTVRIAPVSDLGKLTSEAVLAQYDHAAKSVEAMGDAIRASVAKLEASMKDHVTDLDLITKAADHIREKGKAVQAQIEAAAALTQEVRDICAGFTKKAGS